MILQSFFEAEEYASTHDMNMDRDDDIESEQELQDFLQRGMESNDWTVLREATVATVDNSSYKADIVAQHDAIGWVGIECKYVTGGPVIAAKAARQIFEKYADKKFINHRVTAWGVCLYGNRFKQPDPDADTFTTADEYEAVYQKQRTRCRQIQATTQRILNGFGLGWVTITQSRILMEFLPSGADVQVPLFQTNGDIPQRRWDDFDMDRVEELARERRP